jgi:hypothetical protein
LTSSQNPSTVSQSVSFTANVTPAIAGGTIQFLTNGVLFDTETLSSGSATSVATVSLPPGTNTITAQYSGSGSYGSSANTLSQVVVMNVNTNAATANFNFAVSGGAGSQTLNFSWAADHLGWQLYTNAVGVNASADWFPIPGSAQVSSESITVNRANANVFYQLRYP